MLGQVSLHRVGIAVGHADDDLALIARLAERVEVVLADKLCGGGPHRILAALENLLLGQALDQAEPL